MGRIAKRLLLSAAIGAAGYAAMRALAGNARRFDFRNRLVVITGGSRGLGLVLARLLADEGAALVICARDDAELNAAVDELRMRAPAVAGYKCDLTQPSEIRSLFERIHREIGTVDVLINNAGIIQVGPLETMTLADFHQAMSVHFWAPLLCIDHVLPDMRRRGEGRIVNVASIGGEIAIPHMIPYCASKFALNGLSQGLRAELLKDGIYVTTVCPGLMRTGSARNALMKGQHRAEYAWFSIGAGMPGLSIGAERAARQIIDACRYGWAKANLSLPAKLAVRLNAAMPEIVAEANALVAGLMPEPGGVGRTSVKGAHSTSEWSPSFLTTLADRAAERNNELIADR